MSSIKVRPLRDDLSFGSRITGVTEEVLTDERIRKQINDIFEDRGLIVFEDVEPTSKMHVAISNVFGPLKDHPVKQVARVDQDMMPGVIDMTHNRDKCNLVEIEGRELMSWLPWHFDHCYNNELNRAGVLRALEIPPEGGLTGFADGIQLYDAISPELRTRIESHNVIYTLDLIYDHMRFGRPKSFRPIKAQQAEYDILEVARRAPRAIHPATWRRPSGEKVLHVSPWMAVGIEGHEDPAGDQLLEAVCQEMIAKIQPYLHRWSHTEMLIWDNWRMLHSVTGCDPRYSRRMQRTTIKGDYGLGYFEKGGKGHAVLEMTV
jgi:alpha-ketoglutarate-dependent taurine dioxygenase